MSHAGQHHCGAHKNHVIGDVISHLAGDHLAAERLNRYITDGEVRLANLARARPARWQPQIMPSCSPCPADISKREAALRIAKAKYSGAVPTSATSIRRPTSSSRPRPFAHLFDTLSERRCRTVGEVRTNRVP
jgi:hypothetical protein